MPQKTLIISTSYRKNSNSRALGLRVAEGAKKAGHEVSFADVGRLDIAPCRGCGACKLPGSNFCVIRDAMHDYYPALRTSDHIILCAPIYFFNMNGQCKNFIDRAYAAINNPEGGGNYFTGKKLGAVFTYGDSDPFVSGCVNALRTLQDTALYCKAVWAGAVYGSAYDEGDIMKNAALLDAAEQFGQSL